MTASARAALQLHYTSCRHGLSGYPGFQTRAVSDGLRPEERREIEAAAIYQPPRDLPRAPDAETISAQFPSTFRTFLLSSGRLALVRATYVGQDYSGRWGNYFAHALVVEAGVEPQWPIDAYAWPGWVRALPPEEDASETPPEPLPPVPLDEVFASADFSFAELQTFLAEGDGRVDVLASLIHAVFRQPVDSRRLVLRERLELDTVYWIACLQKAFPAACQKSLSSSTYQFDPRSCLALNATLGETDFMFDESERRYQFHVFDLVNGEHGDVTESPGVEYAEVIASWMARAPERLEQLHAFAELFAIDAIGPDLVHLLRLQRLDAGDTLSLSRDDTLALFAFGKRAVSAVGFGRVLESVEGVIRGLDASSTPDDWALVVRFLADGAARTGEAAHGMRVCQAWLQAFDRLVVDEQRGEAIVTALRDEVEQALGDERRLLAREALHHTRLDRLFTRAPSLPPNTRRIVLDDLRRSCALASIVPTYEALETRSFIEAALSCSRPAAADLRWALEPWATDAGALDSLTRLVVEIVRRREADREMSSEDAAAMQRTLGVLLAGLLAEGVPTLRTEVVRRLGTRAECVETLVAEWEASLERATDKSVAHATYERQFLSGTSPLATSARDLMAERFLDRLAAVGGDLAAAQAREWTRAGRCRSFPDALATRVLALAVHSTTLAPDDRVSEPLVKQLQAELDHRGYRLGRLDLRLALRDAFTKPETVKHVRPMLEGADAATYDEFARVVLPLLLSKATTRAAHRRLLEAVCVPQHAEAFVRAYAAFLRRPAKELEAMDEGVLAFWLRVGVVDPGLPALEPYRAAVLEVMAGRIGGMGRTASAKAVERLQEIPDLRGTALALVMEAFLQQVVGSQTSLLGRIFKRR